MYRPRAADVREVGLDQSVQVAEVIAASFGEDPALRWVLGGDAAPHRVRAWLAPTCKLLHEARQPMLALPHDDRVLGAALIADAATSYTTLAEVRWVLRLARSLGAGVAYRSVQNARAAMRHHPKQPFTYLMMLASHPTVRGQGYGAALMDAVIRRCRADPNSTGVQLETERSVLVRYYQGKGFEVRAEFEVGGVHTYSMFRPKKPTTSETSAPPTPWRARQS